MGAMHSAASAAMSR